MNHRSVRLALLSLSLGLALSRAAQSTDTHALRRIDPSQLPTRAQVESLVEIFEKQNLPYPGLPAAEAVGAFNAGYDAGEYPATSPYDNKCAACSGALRLFFEQAHFPAFVADAPRHTFLLVPVRTETGTQVLVLDPTIRQIYNGAPKTYFLGTKKELEEFHSQAVSKGDGRDRYGTNPGQYFYFDHVILHRTSGWYFLPEETPKSLDDFFPPDSAERKKIDGSMDFEAARRQRNEDDANSRHPDTRAVMLKNQDRLQAAEEAVRAICSVALRALSAE